jgi:hypothetical protein
MKKNILILSMLTSILLSEDSVNQNPIPKDNLIMKENNVLIKNSDELLKQPDVLKYINEAYRKGFEDGAEEAKMIMTKKVEKMGNFMDNLFAFHKLYLEGKLEPPKIGVVSEPVQITKDGKVMIIQQEYMEIIEPAKFVNQPKTWRNFILD